MAHEPLDYVTGPTPGHPHRAFPRTRGLHQRLRNFFIGRPEEFAEPPLGAALYGTLGVMKSKADVHDFILYGSDFAAGSPALSPAGGERVGLIAARLPGWLGPVMVVATPEQPALAEQRRAAVLAMLQGSGLPIVPERVVVGFAPYPGLLGADAANNYDNLILRDARAARIYSLTPTSTTPFGAGAR
jgi:hypothetical protein